jgi:catechol 2,3-dioxygenase-like lactoylglutathione lyase family enzyme
VNVTDLSRARAFYEGVLGLEVDQDFPVGVLRAGLILIVSGRAHDPAVPVVPQSLLRTPVTADTLPAYSSYDMNAAFMPFQQHERGIHAV